MCRCLPLPPPLPWGNNNLLPDGCTFISQDYKSILATERSLIEHKQREGGDFVQRNICRIFFVFSRDICSEWFEGSKLYMLRCAPNRQLCVVYYQISPHSTVFQPLVNRANSWYYQIYKIVMISNIILKCYIQQKNTRYKNVLRSPNIISPKVQMNIKLIMCSKTEKLSQIRSFNQKGQFSPKKTECWFNFVNLVMEFCYNCWKMKVLQALTLLLEF